MKRVFAVVEALKKVATGVVGVVLAKVVAQAAGRVEGEGLS